ncbi:hypothetical protein [Bacillus sp. 2205SS5-2]|uniref:hypothetical protein n=1 Tax=Bacillus sp. 2205SS5-2 TaxID=3109031 RepID=UPI003007617D
MKKLFSILILLLALMGTASQVSASSFTEDQQKAIDLIGKTNQEIKVKIEEAAEKADKLQAEYLADILKLEEGKKATKLKEEREKILAELDENASDESKVDKLHKKLAEIESDIEKEQERTSEKVKKIQKELSDLTVELAAENEKDYEKTTKKIDNLKDKLKKVSSYHEEITNKYTEDLEKIISKVYDETLEMSLETIEEAAEAGVIAECSWTLVRFADRWVWIDPIKIVGEN